VTYADEILLECEASYEDLQYQVYSLQGQMITSGAIRDQRVSVNWTTKGIFLLRVFSESRDVVFKIKVV